MSNLMFILNFNEYLKYTEVNKNSHYNNFQVLLTILVTNDSVTVHRFHLFQWKDLSLCFMYFKEFKKMHSFHPW